MSQHTRKPEDGDEVSRVEFSTVPHVVSELKGLATALAMLAVVGPALMWATGARLSVTGSLLHDSMLAVVVCFVFPTPLVTLLLLGNAGRGVADAEGLRFTPLFRRERALRWASVERLRWSQIADLRGDGGERIVIRWQQLDRERRAALQDLMRRALADRYDLSDVGGPLRRRAAEPRTRRAVLSSSLRVLALTAACLVPAAVGYPLALSGRRTGGLLIMLSVLVPLVIAFREARRLSRDPSNPSRWRTSRLSQVFP